MSEEERVRGGDSPASGPEEPGPARHQSAHMESDRRSGLPVAREASTAPAEAGLLSCPFCGATGESHPLWGRASVLHPDGDCCLARHHVWLEQWNTRATPTRSAEERAALAELESIEREILNKSHLDSYWNEWASRIMAARLTLARPK